VVAVVAVVALSPSSLSHRKGTRVFPRVGQRGETLHVTRHTRRDLLSCAARVFSRIGEDREDREERPSLVCGPREDKEERHTEQRRSAPKRGETHIDTETRRAGKVCTQERRDTHRHRDTQSREGLHSREERHT
jgi:hypothetical protein